MNVFVIWNENLHQFWNIDQSKFQNKLSQHCLTFSKASAIELSKELECVIKSLYLSKKKKGVKGFPFAISFCYPTKNYDIDHDVLHVYANSKQQAKEFGEKWMERQRPEIKDYEIKVVGNNPNFTEMINTPKKIKREQRSLNEFQQRETVVEDNQEEIDF